ncbi:MAG: prepilin-type N-terminal cleavage/methylation domain-containing protein [Lentisphaeraceae bacterium]|nr:prepilin-type N-terminal cleavage/methylation domain-containing protein [Lentisphaeraceae bacterium]
MNKKLHNFTLIELLIVIAIIAILCTLLIPSIGRSREISRNAVCMSNLKQIYTGLQAYVTSNNGWLPIMDDDNAAKNTWPLAVDEFLTATKHTRIHRHTQVQSSVWTSCPGRAEFREGLDGAPIKSEDVDYGIFIKTNYRMVSNSLMKVQDPANSGILADADQEAGRPDIGNSWFMPADREDIYNNITGKTSNSIKHIFRTKMNTTTLDGAVHSKPWMYLPDYTAKYGTWVNQ